MQYWFTQEKLNGKIIFLGEVSAHREAMSIWNKLMKDSNRNQIIGDTIRLHFKAFKNKPSQIIREDQIKHSVL